MTTATTHGGARRRFERAGHHHGWRWQHHHHRASGSAPRTHREAEATAPEPDSGERNIFIAVDVAGHSRTVASEHAGIQHDLRRILTESATDAHLPVHRWVVQPQGDGVLVKVPLDSEPRHIDDFLAHLQAHLRRRNRDGVLEARLCLRVGIDQGPASSSANGFAGEAPILACRLCDAAATRRAIEASTADLVLALSDQMFRDNVQQDPPE